MDKKNNYSFQDKGWDNMKLILDKEMPEKKRRVIPFYWLLSSAAASIVLIFVLRGNFIEGHTSQKLDLTHRNIEQAAQTDDHLNHRSANKQNEKMDKNSNEVSHVQNIKEHQGSNSLVIVSNTVIPKTKTIDFSSKKQKATSPTKSLITLPISSNIHKGDITSVAEEISSDLKSKEINEEPKSTKLDLSINETSKNILNDRNTNSQAVGNQIQKDESINNDVIKTVDHKISQEITNASTSKNNDFIANNLLTESIDNNISEASAITVFKSENKGKFALELGGDYGLPLKTFTYNVGARYQILEQTKLNTFVGIGGFFSPTDVAYSSIFYNKDNNNFFTQSKVNNTIDQIVGARLFTQINFKLWKDKEFYAHLKGGLQYIRLLASSEKQENISVGISNAPSSTSRDQTPIIEVSNNPLNLFGQIGLGYRIKRLGIELHYGLSQNTFRNSPLQGINQKVNHSIGSTVLWYF